jgi:hypothetical protein
MALGYFVFIYLYSIPVAGIARELEAEKLYKFRQYRPFHHSINQAFPPPPPRQYVSPFRYSRHSLLGPHGEVAEVSPLAGFT